MYSKTDRSQRSGPVAAGGPAEAAGGGGGPAETAGGGGAGSGGAPSRPPLTAPCPAANRLGVPPLTARHRLGHPLIAHCPATGGGAVPGGAPSPPPPRPAGPRPAVIH